MNTAMRWEPFHRFDEFFNNLSPLFGRLPSTAAASNEPDLGWMPVTDILEGEKEYVVKLDLPEVPREAVEVLADDDTLLIKGERKLVREKGYELLRSEIGYGPFERRFMLPDIVDRQHIRADFRDGVLLVHLPKAEQKVVAPRKIAIS